jgi:hypothetical protein
MFGGSSGLVLQSSLISDSHRGSRSGAKTMQVANVKISEGNI